jgi:hypothetical protein
VSALWYNDCKVQGGGAGNAYLPALPNTLASRLVRRGVCLIYDVGEGAKAVLL